MIDIRDLIDFIEWYWKEIDGKPSVDSAMTIAEYYLEDKEKQMRERIESKREEAERYSL